MLLNCGVEKTLKSPLDCKEIKSVNPKGYQSWIFIGRTDVEAETNTLATWCEELTHWKRPWCWERLKAGEEGDDRGWDGWMASPTQWTWVWVNSGSWWWTGRPCVLQFRGLQRVGHDWVTELNWTDACVCVYIYIYISSASQIWKTHYATIPYRSKGIVYVMHLSHKLPHSNPSVNSYFLVIFATIASKHKLWMSLLCCEKVSKCKFSMCDMRIMIKSFKEIVELRHWACLKLKILNWLLICLFLQIT